MCSVPACVSNSKQRWKQKKIVLSCLVYKLINTKYYLLWNNEKPLRVLRLPPTVQKNMHVRLIGDSKLSLGVSVSVCGCLSRLSLCGPMMDWRPVQGVPSLSPDDRWDRLQSPATQPTD